MAEQVKIHCQSRTTVRTAKRYSMHDEAAKNLQEKLYAVAADML